MKVTRKGKMIKSVHITKEDYMRASASVTDVYGRILLLGDLGVGKTSLLKYLIGCTEQKRLTELCCPITTTVHICRQERRLVASVIDTGGQEKYRSLTASYYRGAHGCLILFDVTKLSTFENIEYWLHDLKEYNTQPEIATILIGTKCHVSEEEREVKRDRAQKYAENVRLPYMEVSAEQGINVTEAFEKLADMIIENLSKQPTMTPVTKPTILTEQETQKKKNWCAC